VTLDPEPETSPTKEKSAFHHRGFVLYWSARFLSAFSMQIVSVAVGWYIYDQTRDPLMLGFVGLVQFAPSLLLVLVTGSVADRFNRRRIIGACIAVGCLCSATLMLLSLREGGPIWPIFAVLAVFGIARAFFSPAVQSLVANLVPRETFANAVAWNATSWQTAMIVGPVAGGLLYGISPVAAFGTSTVFLAVGSALTFLIPKPAQKTTSGRNSWETLLGGFHYIWHHPVVLGAITLDLFAVILGGATALLPVFARDILDVGPWGLGLLRSAPGIGAVAMGVWLVRHPIRNHAGIVLFASIAVFGTMTIVFGTSTVAWLSIMALILIGGADMISIYMRANLVQLQTPDELRGRVSAVNSVFIGASNELGEFRAGTMAAFIGAVPAVVFGGVGAIAVAGAGLFLFPELRRTRRLDGR
jgi:MFS family permease